MEAVIFIGIQGAGKSTFFQQRFFDTHVRINLDMLKTRYREQVFLQGILGTQKRLQPPRRAEGFDRLFCVTVTETNEFVLEDCQEEEEVP